MSPVNSPFQKTYVYKFLTLYSVLIWQNMLKSHNLATLQCEIWQPCLSEAFDNVTSQFPVQKQVYTLLATLSLQYAKISESGNPAVRNLATLFVGHFRKCHQSIPCPKKHKHSHFKLDTCNTLTLILCNSELFQP